MRTIQMTLGDDLVEAPDKVIKELKINRSFFTRKTLQDAVAKHKIRCFEEQHRRGYRQHPVQGAEFGVWEKEIFESV